MFTVTFEIGEGAKKIVEPNTSAIPEGLISPILNRVTLKLEAIIKMQGFAPRDKGRFAGAHRSVLESLLTKYIMNDIRVGMNASYLGISISQSGEFLWKYIVNGHSVLTTLRAKRWWWATHPEGYERKTSGAKGYVPPNDYLTRAVNALISSGFIQSVVAEETKRYFV